MQSILKLLLELRRRWWLANVMLLIRMFPVITGRTLVLKSHAKNLELVPKQNHSTNDQTQNRNKVYNRRRWKMMVAGKGIRNSC